MTIHKYRNGHYVCGKEIEVGNMEHTGQYQWKKVNCKSCLYKKSLNSKLENVLLKRFLNVRGLFEDYLNWRK